jgi:hypothetical protein
MERPLPTRARNVFSSAALPDSAARLNAFPPLPLPLAVGHQLGELLESPKNKESKKTDHNFTKSYVYPFAHTILDALLHTV